MWHERGCQTNFRWECFTPGMPRRARHKLYVRTGHNFQKTRLYEHPPHTGWYIHNAYCPFAIQRSEASKAINIWAFTKLEKYKDSTSPSMVVLVMHCPLLWLFEAWWNILILKSYLNLILILANPNHHDGDRYLKQNPVIMLNVLLILANDCDDQ